MALLTTNNPFMLGFDSLERMLDRAEKNSESYPPYNIEQIDPTHLQITIAVAGFGGGTAGAAVHYAGVLEYGGKLAVAHFAGICAGNADRHLTCLDGMAMGLCTGDDPPDDRRAQGDAGGFVYHPGAGVDQNRTAGDGHLVYHGAAAGVQ